VLKKDGKTVTFTHELELSPPDATPEKKPSPKGTIRNLTSPGKEMGLLAREYEDIRRSVPSGDARTARMQIVASKMRSLARSNYASLEDLTASPSAGERLAAV
jgi:hypothetical protein